MKKYAIVLFALISVLSAKAQKDSLKKIRFSGIQADIGTHYFPDYKQLSREDYQKFVKNNKLLYADVSGYKVQNGYYYTSYEGLVGLRFYATIQDSRKLKKEVHMGLRYGQESNIGLSLNKSTHDTVAVYTSGNNETYYKIRTTDNNYNFGISSQKLILPLGFNFTTNKDKHIWISYGVEVSPFINFKYQFQSYYSTSYIYTLVKQGDSLMSPENLTTNNSRFNTSYYGGSERTKLNGVGYGAYLSLPFAVYLHPFLKTRFLKHINLMASITPGLVYSYSKFYGSTTAGGANFAVGVRYNW
ncbi:hypothetical protein CNR22_10470 [Sphingobacteriaceae bacterium]|nr:hypothetical protein CNR22_10470 [Sphingobacteriaceae bacterium]